MPTLGVTMLIFCTVVSSTRMLGSFFSVASTTPFVARMPSDVAPAFTAVSAYSIWTSLPLGLKVVRLKEYCGCRDAREAMSNVADEVSG